MPADASAAPGRPASVETPTTTPSVSILDVLRKPQVARTLGSSVLARLPYGAMILLTVLRVTDAGHSYGDAGLTSATYSIGMALGSTLLSRRIDRTGQTRILLITGASGACATAAIGLVPSSSPLWLFVVLAGLNGALQPPLAGVMRALWDVLLVRAEERHVGFAIEAAAVEVVFTGGPLVIVGGIAGAFGPSAGLLVSACLTGGGTVLFAMSGPSRAWRPHADRVADWAGPLRSRGVRTIMLATAGAGGAFGAMEIGITAFSRAHHHPSLVGLLLAVWALGSFAGGLVLARIPPAKDAARRLVFTLSFMAAGNAVLGLWHAPWALAAWSLVAGATIAPTFATTNATMGHVAPAGMMTEAFAFTIGAVMIGSTISAPIAGTLVDHVSAGAALSFAGAMPAISAAIVWLRRATLRPETAS